MENLIMANWPYFILRADQSLEAFNDLDCMLISIWLFEIRQNPSSSKQVYIPMASATIDLEKMVAVKDDNPGIEL